MGLIIGLLTIKQKHLTFPFQIWYCERKTKTFITQILYWYTCRKTPFTGDKDMINNLKEIIYQKYNLLSYPESHCTKTFTGEQ